MPVLLDEYRTGTWSSHELNAIHHELRSAYGGEAESRGKPNLSVESFRLTAPVVLCGEDRPRDAALDHRIISLNLCKTTLEDADRKEAFRSASSESLEAFALPYWAWSLGREDWLDELSAARRWTETWTQTTCPSVPDRILNNLAILRFGWTMFGRYADHLGLTPAALVADSFETALLAVVLEVAPEGAARSGLDELVSILHAMAANGRIRHDQHFGQTQEGQVLLPLDALLPEARRYARETAAPTQLMGLDSYRQQIAEAGKQPGSYVAEASGRAYIAGKRRRGCWLTPRSWRAGCNLTLTCGTPQTRRAGWPPETQRWRNWNRSVRLPSRRAWLKWPSKRARTGPASTGKSRRGCSTRPGSAWRAPSRSRARA